MPAGPRSGGFLAVGLQPAVDLPDDLVRQIRQELLEKLAALIPLPRMHLVRYGGCLAPHSHLRGAIVPTPRQQGVEEQEDNTGSPRWKRPFALPIPPPSGVGQLCVLHYTEACRICYALCENSFSTTNSG